jgi:hypothetical protein
MMTTRTIKWLPILLLAFACKGRDKKGAGATSPMEADMAPARGSGMSPAISGLEDANEEAGGAGVAMSLDEGKMGKRDSERADGQYKMRSKGYADDKPEPKKAQPPRAPGPAGKDGEKKEEDNKHKPEAVTRAWFPETFLFEPLVITDDKGEATVPVRVPDRLTTWRVLALAHSRSGAQGGATTSFLGTLPSYVDPVVPGFLIAGDKIKLPVQMVNTTDQPITAKLDYQIEGAQLAGGEGPKTVPAGGSLVEYPTLTAARAGTIKLRIGLGGTDAVMRTIDVIPSGKPVTVTRAGSLAAPRTLTIEGPAGSDPATDRVRLMVYPGALALLRSELAVSIARSGVAEDGYALLLAGNAPKLLQQLGDKPDAQVLRELSLVTGQRAIRHGRTLDVTRASLLAEAALAHLDNPVLARLGERAVAYLAQHQRPDGTFSGATGWTMQRVLVATADGTRAASANLSTAVARQRAQGVQAKAAAAFARHFETATDAYTAAAILASGAVKGELADKYRKRVLDGIKANDDGAKYLHVGENVVRADGTVPSVADATALAVLALDGVKDAPLADLGTTLLGSYTPVYGWGDGRTNLAAMRAILKLFQSPLPASVKITLKLDGKELATGTFDSAKLKDVLVLDAAAASGGGFAGSHEWSITAEPAVPGLGFSLALDAWVPWEKQTTTKGLELQLPAKITGKVGKPVELAVTAIAPSNRPVHIRHALPAGVQPDRPSLEALVASGAISRFETADGKVDLHVNPLQPGQVFTAKYKVIPTLAGTLHAAASLIETGPTLFHVPPSEWTIE